MKFEAGQIYHIYNQGNNREPIFFNEENYHYFRRKMEKHLLPFCDIICYCLMPNHFHWLIMPNDAASQASRAVKPSRRLEWDRRPRTKIHLQENLSNAIGTLISSYTRGVNIQQERTGSLFRAKTKMKNGWIDQTIVIDGQNQQMFFRAQNNYAAQCFQYIHQNPVKAGLCHQPTQWAFSSAREYAGLTETGICAQHLGQALSQPENKLAA